MRPKPAPAFGLEPAYATWAGKADTGPPIARRRRSKRFAQARFCNAATPIEVAFVKSQAMEGRSGVRCPKWRGSKDRRNEAAIRDNRTYTACAGWA
jgi:hypothetical protein